MEKNKQVNFDHWLSWENVTLMKCKSPLEVVEYMEKKLKWLRENAADIEWTYE